MTVAVDLQSTGDQGKARVRRGATMEGDTWVVSSVAPRRDRPRTLTVDSKSTATVRASLRETEPIGSLARK